MGVVLRAYDPELEREVALKILRTRSGEAQSAYRATVLAEARALAKLRHDNVVGIYDVGEGEDQIWIAMEFVRGVSLRAWMDAQPRSPAEVQKVLREAGAGLIAAHEAGIVHCDVKPENIVVADRAYVIDFGLAHGVGSRDGSAGAPDGTAAYLAPELYAGASASLASDVYAFCVTAWEVLFGARPWSATEEDELLRQKKAVPKIPSRSGVPRPLTRLLREGLSADPNLRPASLGPLVAALNAPRRTTRRVLAGLGVAAVAIVWGLNRAPDCEPPSGKEPFTSASTAGIREALESHSPEAAAVQWAVIESNLTAFENEHARQYRGACEATHVRHESSRAEYETQLACLDRRRQQLSLLVAELEGADADALREAPRSIARLSGALSCDNPAPSRVAAVFEAELDRVEVLELLSRFEEAFALTQDIEADAQRAGDHATQLWARYRRGRLLHLRGEATDAAALLSEVHWDAEEANLPKLASTAGLYVLFLHAAVFDDSPEALSWAPHVGAAVRRAGDEVLDRAVLIESTGIAKLYGNRVPEAFDDFVTSLELRESVSGDVELSIVSSLGNLGIALEELGRYDEAIEYQSRALEILERRLGTTHPHTARAADNLGTARLRSGDVAGALTLFERALEARRGVFGETHRSTAISRLHVGLAHLEAGRLDLAIEAFEAGLAVAESLEQPGGLLTTALEGLAHAHADRQHWPEAAARARAALASLPESMPESHRERQALREIIQHAAEAKSAASP